MSHSGVVCSDVCVQAFNDLKLKKAYQWLALKIDKGAIEVSASGPRLDDSADPKEAYAAFLRENLKATEPAYYVYDLVVDKKAKLILLVWNPDAGSIKNKMIYASSLEALKSKLTGVSTTIQATDLSEVEYSYIITK